MTRVPTESYDDKTTMRYCKTKYKGPNVTTESELNIDIPLLSVEIRHSSKITRLSLGWADRTAYIRI